MLGGDFSLPYFQKPVSLFDTYLITLQITPDINMFIEQRMYRYH